MFNSTASTQPSRRATVTALTIFAVGAAALVAQVETVHAKPKRSATAAQCRHQSAANRERGDALNGRLMSSCRQSTMYYPLTAASIGKLASQLASNGKYDDRQEPEVGRSRDARRADKSHIASETNTRLFCVRLSDGYYFPAPNSQFVGEKDAETTLDRCRYICDTNGIEVYALQDMNLETEEMVSVEGSKSYTELPSAFRYRRKSGL